MSALKKIQIISLALLVLVSGMGMSSPAALFDTCDQYYTLGKSDSLEKVAARYNLSLADLMDLNMMPVPWFIFPGQQVCVSKHVNSRGPDIRIDATVRDQSVRMTVRTGVKNARVDILMGPAGSKGIRGVNVGAANTGKTGGFQTTVNIPASLKGANHLDVRVQLKSSKDPIPFRGISTGFYNMTSGPKGYSDVPSIVITRVVRNTRVDVTIHNLPPNKNFNVLMGAYLGNRHYPSFKVGSLSSSVGGTVTASFNIPSGLYRAKEIVLALQNISGGCSVYKKFLNQNQSSN
ncbi:MAG: LysM domain-containing protein [Chloroflexota bacterium]